MATWLYFGVGIYGGTSGTVSFLLSGDNSNNAIMSDNEPDTTFEAGDPVTSFDTYIGSVEIDLVAGGTVSLPVATYAGSTYVLTAEGVSEAAYIWPATIDLDALNTAPLAACFLAGTGIATRSGEVPVERLEIGDWITSQNGEVRVKWIGRQTISTRFGPAERLLPFRIAAGALGDNLPHTDLTVTADHAMLIDGVLCHAGALVNGTTITRVPLAEMGEAFTVYHVETEAHEIILANGAPAETFIDNVSRRVFDNFAEFEALYGDVPEMQELPLPRAMSARQVPVATRARLSNRPETGGATSLKSA